MKKEKISLSKPYVSGNEFKYIKQAALTNKKLSGNGEFTKKCHTFFEQKYGFKKVLLTPSCTHALEMAALIIGIKPGDEVIVPSFTFSSTASAFAIHGAKLVFCDSEESTPNIDCEKIEKLITKKTKVIVPMHYAGFACDMDKIMAIADKHKLFVVEDAAQAVDSFYKKKPLGSLGHFSAFSFHDTKNVISGEGGMLVINRKKYIDRAEVIWDKGTNKVAFQKGKIKRYGCIDIGSSFLMSEINAAFLYAQLENLKKIQKRRKIIWDFYYKEFLNYEKKNYFKLPFIPRYSSNNYHTFFLVCNERKVRDDLMKFLNAKNISASFHFSSLDESSYYKDKCRRGPKMLNSKLFSDCLIRLPLFHTLSREDMRYVVSSVKKFFKEKK